MAEEKNMVPNNNSVVSNLTKGSNFNNVNTVFTGFSNLNSVGQSIGSRTNENTGLHENNFELTTRFKLLSFLITELKKLNIFVKCNGDQNDKIFIAGGMAHQLYRQSLNINNNKTLSTIDIDVFCVIYDNFNDVIQVERLLFNTMCDYFYSNPVLKQKYQKILNTNTNTINYSYYNNKKNSRYSIMTSNANNDPDVVALFKISIHTNGYDSITYTIHLKENDTIFTLFDFTIYKASSSSGSLLQNVQYIETIKSRDYNLPLIPLHNLCELSIHALFNRCIKSIKYSTDSKYFKKSKQDFRRLNKLFTSIDSSTQDPIFNEFKKLFYALISADILPFKTDVRYSKKIRDYLGVTDNINESKNGFENNPERTALSRYCVSRFIQVSEDGNQLLVTRTGLDNKNLQNVGILNMYIVNSPLLVPSLIFDIYQKLQLNSS